MCTCVASHQDWNVQMQGATGLNAKSHRRHADQQIMQLKFLGQTIYKKNLKIILMVVLSSLIHVFFRKYTINAGDEVSKRKYFI